ncbi:uncharacterized protein A4U43_C01F8060 [Asparagus officinalis]|uniref:Methyltransferase n=1 Tax=Asparagus officinalis TaxID=4686 RepID=A0A5P1FNJ6_ASPOF|nr:uncharacterized protein A4U43_C01F8060 [Asparagus officinalis]
MRGRADGGQKKNLVPWICAAVLFIVFLFVYYGSFFDPQGQHASTALEYGSRFSRSLGFNIDDDGEVAQTNESIFGEEGDSVALKSIPVCDDRHSELIPCLDRHLIYQLRLKLDLSLMEHYERHCPPPERRYNCLIPPPPGYKVPIKWPKSRDEVWQANIPHTHLAHEKSDQRWMVVKGDKIEFPGGNLEPNLQCLTNDCYYNREPGTQPPMCSSRDDPDAVWGVPMKACITPYSEQNHRDQGSGLVPWPARLTTPPPRLADFDYTTEMFEKDTETWQQRVENYWKLLSRKIKPNTIRNIMDMRANLGSFAAALKDRDVWVMNVVPEDGPNTLKIVYDRGLIGSIHDWCEAYSTYPRTYDLLHAWTVFSGIEKKGCSAEDLLIEMDRILRPTGFVIVRDTKIVIDFIKKHLKALHWEEVARVDAEPNEDDTQDGDVILVIRKKMWLVDDILKDSD